MWYCVSIPDKIPIKYIKVSATKKKILQILLQIIERLYYLALDIYVNWSLWSFHQLQFCLCPATLLFSFVIYVPPMKYIVYTMRGTEQAQKKVLEFLSMIFRSPVIKLKIVAIFFVSVSKYECCNNYFSPNKSFSHLEVLVFFSITQVCLILKSQTYGWTFPCKISCLRVEFMISSVKMGMFWGCPGTTNL